jgi:hypothetical protein
LNEAIGRFALRQRTRCFLFSAQSRRFLFRSFLLRANACCFLLRSPSRRFLLRATLLFLALR